MNIWAWTDGIDYEVSSPMYELASAVNDGRHKDVDSIVPMLVGMARERGLPWVEIYARHWELQSLIFHRQNPAVGLPKAVALLERAHRDDAIDCPQSVCATQDLAGAFGLSDGPGYAEVRLQACIETMDRINPAWPCWSCISAERGDALIDAGRAAEAVEFLPEQERLMEKAGSGSKHLDVRYVTIKALIKEERFEDALALARKKRKPHGYGDSVEMDLRSAETLALAALEKWGVALKRLAPLSDILDTGKLDIHAETLDRLVRGGALEFDEERIGEFAALTRESLKRGAYDICSQIALAAADLCVLHSRKEIGNAFVDMASEAADGLRDPARLDTQVEERRANVNALEPDASSLDIEGWRTLGFPNVASRIARREYDEAPDDDKLHKLASLYHDSHSSQDLRQLLDEAMAHDELQVMSLWHLSILEQRENGVTAAIDPLRQLVSIQPDSNNAVWRLAWLLSKAEELQESLTYYNQTVELIEEPGGHDWERMVVATRVGDFGAVRDSAARLELEIESDEGPIEEKWGWCIIRYTDGDELYAMRTGPVTARVDQFPQSGGVQRYDDLVVFDPAPVNADDQDATNIYKHVETLSQGGYVYYPVDGLHPGDEVLDAMRDALTADGFVVHKTSSDEYLLRDPDSGDDVLGVYLKIGIRTDQSTEELHEKLASLTTEQGDPQLIWLELLDELNLEEVAQQQREIASRWRL